MKPIFVVKLTDPYGHDHLIATDVKSEEEYEKLKACMELWTPNDLPRSKSWSGGAMEISREAIFDSLKLLTGHEFYELEADYRRHIDYTGLKSVYSM